MTALIPTQEPQLRHLTVFNGVYAEADHGRFYAIRSHHHMWRIVSRDHEFPPSPRRTVEECDAWLTVWLATR
jgi:hypothetical protein